MTKTVLRYELDEEGLKPWHAYGTYVRGEDYDALQEQRDAAVAILRRFVNFAVEMPSDMGTCLAMGNKIVVDARELLKTLPSSSSGEKSS